MTKNSTTSLDSQHLLDRLEELIHEILESPCRNATWNILEELRHILQKTRGDIKDVKVKDTTEEDSMAVLYIVFVLLFFATSLLIVLLKYLRREREETRLQNFYEDYLRRRRSRKVVRYDNEGRCLKRKQARLMPNQQRSLMLSTLGVSSVSDPTPPDTPIIATLLNTPIDHMPIDYGVLEHDF